eukprot:PITA_30599
MFALSPWYSDIIYVLKNLSPPPGMTRNKARTLKLKAAKFCILNSALYWKDPGGVLLNFLVEKEAKKVMEDCHQGDCGDRVSQKKSICTSPFELVYGVDTVFPTSLDAPVVKLLQEADNEEDPMQKRLNQKVLLQQTREQVFKNTSKFQEKIKKIYDKKAKVDKFQLDDVVLKWDARNEEKGKHGKFKNLWKGPFKVVAYRGQNAFLLKEMNGEDCPIGLINGRLLKRYHF